MWGDVAGSALGGQSRGCCGRPSSCWPKQPPLRTDPGEVSCESLQDSLPQRLPHLHRVPGNFSPTQTPPRETAVSGRGLAGGSWQTGQWGGQAALSCSLLTGDGAVLHLGPELGQIGGKKTETKGKHMLGGPEGRLRDRDT